MNWTLLLAILGSTLSLALGVNQIIDSRTKRRREEKEIAIQEEEATDSQTVSQINATLSAMKMLNENLDERYAALEREHKLILAQNNILMRRDLVRERRENILRNLIEDKLGQEYPKLPAIPQMPDLDTLREVG